MENHRNRFIRLGLSLDMRLVIAVLTLSFVMFPARAMSLTEFEAKPAHDQSVYVVNFIEKSTADLYAKNPNMAQAIRDWFSKEEAGKPFSESTTLRLAISSLYAIKQVGSKHHNSELFEFGKRKEGQCFPFCSCTRSATCIVTSSRETA